MQKALESCPGDGGANANGDADADGDAGTNAGADGDADADGDVDGDVVTGLGWAGCWVCFLKPIMTRGKEIFALVSHCSLVRRGIVQIPGHGLERRGACLALDLTDCNSGALRSC